MNKQLTFYDIEDFSEDKCMYHGAPDDNITRCGIYSNYNAFVDKFKGKKTTDDCYTPDDIYNVVASYVRGIIGDREATFVRPFYPGGDYQNYDYPQHCIVVDNPPFSIYAKIVRYYIEQKIEFFLFAPAITQIVNNCDCTYIIGHPHIKYENGASVATGFTTNIHELSQYRIISDTSLYKEILAQPSQRKVSNPVCKISYDKHIATMARLFKFAKTDFRIGRKECIIDSNCDGMRELGKSTFGGCILLNDKWANVFNTSIIDDDGIRIDLSEREQSLINKLS